MVKIWAGISNRLKYIYTGWVIDFKLWLLGREIARILKYGTVRDIRDGGMALENFGREHTIESAVELGRQMQWEAEDIVLSR